LEQECEIAGAPVVLAVRVRSAEAAAVGAQFTLDYDPAALDFIGIEPGSACDPASPFDSVLFQDADESAGQVFYGVGLGMGDPGSLLPEPTAVACVTFLPRTLGASAVCLFDGPQPRRALLSDNTGLEIEIVNSSDCPTAAAGPVITCAEVRVSEKCSCTPGGGQCQILDSDCVVGQCDVVRGVCATAPSNEGGACQDGDDCTSDDSCHTGRCVGTNCTNPSLCLAHEGCVEPGGLTTIRIELGQGEPLISGGQFSLQFDPAQVELVGLSPGRGCDPDSPFSVELTRNVDLTNGTLFYAVAIELGGSPTRGPATLACVMVRLRGQQGTEVCSFNAINPFTTALVDENGQRVDAFNLNDCPSDRSSPITSCVNFIPCRRIPTVSFWGLAITTLLILIVAKISEKPRRMAGQFMMDIRVG
jgi:hypothetical protein